MVVSLWVMSCEANRVDKFERNPNTTYKYAKSYGASFDCLLKDNTSFVSPVFLVKLDAPTVFKELPNYLIFNYTNALDGARYYFINDIVSVSNGLYELYCTFDPLTTFKDYVINNLKCVVERAEYEYNPYLDDIAYPVTEKNIQTIVKQYTLFEEPSNKNSLCYAMCVFTEKSPFSVVGSYKNVTPYTFSLPSLIYSRYDDVYNPVYMFPTISQSYGSGDTLWRSYGFRDIRKVLISDSRASSFVLSCIRYPFDLNGIIPEAVPRAKLYFGSGQITDRKFVDGQGDDANLCWAISSNNKTFREVLIPVSDLNLHNDFRDFSPYTMIQIYLPFYGAFSINVKDIIAYNKLYISIVYSLEFSTGNATIYISLCDRVNATHYVIDTLNCILGEPVDLSSTTSDQVDRQKQVNKLELISGSVRNAGNLAAGVTSGAIRIATAGLSNPKNPIGGIASGAAEIITSAERAAAEESALFLDRSAKEVNNIPFGSKAGQSNSIYSSLLLHQNTIILTKNEVQIVSDDLNLRYHTYGRPLNSIKNNLSDMNGYVKLLNFHLDNLNALENDKVILSQILKDGILLPDPPST